MAQLADVVFDLLFVWAASVRSDAFEMGICCLGRLFCSLIVLMGLDLRRWTSWSTLGWVALATAIPNDSLVHLNNGVHLGVVMMARGGRTLSSILLSLPASAGVVDLDRFLWKYLDGLLLKS